MNFKDFMGFFPAAIQENSVKLTPAQLAEIVDLLEGLDSQPESTCETIKVWIRNHPEVRDSVINFAHQKNVANPLPDRENVKSPRQKLSSEAEILQNLFELRRQVRLQKDAPKNLPPKNN